MEYIVCMVHKMRSAKIVEAESQEEAREIAYTQSFEEGGWEEIDTDYVSIRKFGTEEE